MKNLEGVLGASEVGLTADQLKALVDYLDANAIEYILKKEQQEIAIRFVMLFSDFPPTEVFINGQMPILRKKVAIIGLLKPSQGCNREKIFGHVFTSIKQSELTAEIIFYEPSNYKPCEA